MLMSNPADAKRFALAGNSTITLSSKNTGVRFTYRIKAFSNDENPHVSGKRSVALLTGADNESDYTYLGMIFGGTQFRTTAKSKLAPTSSPALAMQYFCQKVIRDGVMPEHLEVRHEGRCGKCNRKLTTPESIDRGIGPECWRNM